MTTRSTVCSSLSMAPSSATTWNQTGTYRLTDATCTQYGLAQNTLEISRGALRAAVGQDVRHFKSWEVAPGRPQVPEVIRRLEDASAQKSDADAEISEWLTEGRREGIAIAKLAKATGLKTRQAVYDRIGDMTAR